MRLKGIRLEKGSACGPRRGWGVPARRRMLTLIIIALIVKINPLSAIISRLGADAVAGQVVGWPPGGDGSPVPNHPAVT